MYANENEPDHIELAALGSVLQSFYNGIEGIFLLIAKQIDETVPNDSSWHQVLLNRMTEITDKRPSVITPETADLLAMYMKFRHFFRHAYSFTLNWLRMSDLANSIMSVWQTAKDELLVFMDSIKM
jgi:hypothetical protein